MTILIDHHSDHNGDNTVEKNVTEEETELVLDGVFVAPHTNSFGHTFRDYDAQSERKRSVEEFYKTNHIGQTVDFVRRMREEYGKLNRTEMSIWECCELLNEFVDESDPDLDEPQIEHLLQTAEAIRKDYPDEDWLHLTGLIHDLGKVLLHSSFGELPQWAVVGDTYPVGCAFDESIVHHKYFKENPDFNNPSYNTKYGIYTEGCGLDNVFMSWGHDDYMRMREEYGKLNRTEMSIWECCELLNEFVDESDPDLDEPQIEHLLQTAEAIRKDYPDEDWLHLTGLIHDLGKVLLHSSFGELPQWAVVGDTYPVGCAFDESIVHHKYFKENPDFNNPSYNTKYGIYTEGCGLDNVFMSWGHDDYMYLVAKENKTTLPSAGLFIIRYHSFYALHKSEAYKHLMNEEDRENMKWLKVFNKYDLYSKSKVRINVEEVKPYYLSLINKYFPAKLKW
ncbi:hypothetical protein DY000_02045302 [Brassica cretica]|uniref:inositol oxygenase n=1 Tax=Brassica cretica TaxID=69181 RepID=A0ABQ7ERX2_BRACR|nr:hypothetical protein DY000_02045302 [Brassica cretica]